MFLYYIIYYICKSINFKFIIMLQFTSKYLTLKIELTFLIVLVLLFLLLAKLSENSNNRFYVRAGIMLICLFVIFGFDWVLRVISHFTITK